MNRRTVMRALAGAAAMTMVWAMAGCSEKSEQDSSESSSAGEASSLAQVNEAKTGDSGTGEAEDEIDRLNERIEKLSARLDELEEFSGDFDFGEEVHEVYDDTAVVEAYKKKDPSGLTDPKDKFIYDNLVTAVDEIIDEGMSDYEKEKAVYDYIFYGTRFNDESLSPIDFGEEDDNSHNPYGFFRDHTTICVGNATTFKLFMDVLGINCEIIHSTEEGEHAWNIVQIDGDWYHVDVTFDGGSETPLYTNFNVTDEVKEGVGYPWNIEDFHECTATKYNYVMMNAKELKDVYEIPKAMKDYLGQGTTAMYVALDVPEGVDGYSFAYGINNVVDMLTSDRYYFSSGEPMFSDDGARVTLVISIYDNEEDEDYYYEPEDTGFDMDKLREAFEKDLDGQVTVAEDYWW